MDNVRTPSDQSLNSSNSINSDLSSSLEDMQIAGPDMVVDNYTEYTAQDNGVVNINPDAEENGEEQEEESRVRADDCM